MYGQGTRALDSKRAAEDGAAALVASVEDTI
jgi:hypothetical protein